jgi:hypothetical protein
MYIDPLRRMLFGVQVSLAAGPAGATLRLDRSYHRLRVIRVDIRAPELGALTVVLRATCEVAVPAGKRHAIGSSLRSRASVAGVAEPLEQRTQGDQASGGDSEAGFNVGPDRDVGCCIWGDVSIAWP